MKLLLSILLLSYIAVASCAVNCKWTGCEGKLRTGYEVCKEYYAGTYTGETDARECGLTSEKVKCCYGTPSRDGCKWTGCYGTAYSARYACDSEFGTALTPATDRFGCQFFQTSYECCPP